MRQVGRIAAALVSNGRWRRSLALVIGFAIGCGLLSWWQFARREETAQASALIAANTTAPPATLAELLPSLTAWDPGERWRTVRVSGEYLTDRQLLVRNRVQDGNPGFEVLTPFRLDDGDVLVLDRGWVSVGTTQDAPDSVPAPPSGRVVVDARLQGDEGPLAGRTAPAGQIPSIDLQQVARDVGAPTYTGAYGQVASESPQPAEVPSRIVPDTQTGVDEGTHLSYAIQWILFAMLGFLALAWSVRRELQDAGDEVILAADARAAVRRSRRAPSDEAVEDALEELPVGGEDRRRPVS
ncbi:SURF1 family protein [Amnibacterium endophyticum]|uniref:SURF1-like protein n=1 Tax=Amnibacterium endophyticum TaxID=2109337 RepID=A0ABW4LCP1_9MICO